jgi:17beta-estradiol 17-dehydrogenase / very-long-chain 3-oxoacyl-CoA reductase
LKKREKRSAVINLSSYATLIPMPYNSMYCATKTYNDIFSKCLSNEYSDTNVEFLSAKPLYVESPLSKMKADGIWVINARECASGIIRHLGYTRYTIGSWKHQLQAAALYFIPEKLIVVFAKKRQAKRMERKNVKNKQN